MSPIRVSLGQIWSRAKDEYAIGSINPVTKRFTEGKPLAEFELARAYITRASPYSRDALHRFFRWKILPDKIIVRGVVINLVYPSMLPYSVVYETWPAHKPEGEVDIEMTHMSDKIRALRMEADIGIASGITWAAEYFTDRRWRTSGFYRRVGEYDGFEWYRDGGSGQHYYDDDADDDVRSVHCYNPPEKLHPTFFCTYRILLNQHLLVDLKFVDFRARGGREFARERIRAFKKFVCPLLGCDVLAKGDDTLP